MHKIGQPLQYKIPIIFQFAFSFGTCIGCIPASRGTSNKLHRIMSKRSADDGAAIGGQPPIKKVQFEPHLIGPVSTLEELDIKVLQFQNKKLAQVGIGFYFICSVG